MLEVATGWQNNFNSGIQLTVLEQEPEFLALAYMYMCDVDSFK